jgi:hypothetical protein
MTPGSLIRFGISTTTRAVEVALALPRIALALERLADTTDDIRRLADAAPAIEAIGALASDARRLLANPASHDDIAAAIAAINQIGQTAATIGPLSDAIKQLNIAATSLTTTVTPLQGMSERLGRFVDRLPAKPRRPIEVDTELA